MPNSSLKQTVTTRRAAAAKASGLNDGQISQLTKRKRANFITQIYQGVAVSFFVLMLVIPTVYQTARGGILLFLLWGALIFYAKIKKLYLTKAVLFWLFLTVLTSLASVLIGLINGTPGALNVVSVFVIWPIVYVFLIGLVGHPASLTPFLRAIVVGSIMAAAMGILLVTDSLFGFGLGLNELFQLQGAIVGLYDGVIEYRLFNMTTVLYSFIFLLATLQIPSHISIFEGRWRIAIWVALGLSVIVLLISGRRAFWLIAFLSPLLISGLARMGRVPVRSFSTYLKVTAIGILLLLSVLPYLGINLLLVFDDFKEGFDFSGQGQESSSIRSAQFWILINAWLENPIFGRGHGASAVEMIRDPDRPWAYELSYVALLFQTGLMGMMVYASAVLWIFAKGVSIMKRQPNSAGFLLPVLAGLVGFLIINATNPYLQKFDYLWVIFLPVAIINVFMLKESR
ncbi:MAG: hypothetical protein L3J30_15040 [Marinosulfonomonas sp.]|nr:hypothetical protein [Marinosulfonomonas sp.]